MSNHTGKTALVTGASSGIGAAYADRFAKRGYDLVLVARRADRLQALASKLGSQYGVQVHCLAADLESDAGQTIVADYITAHPSISVLVNNAGTARLAPLAGSALSDSVSQVALNITALTRLTHAILPAMKASNSGLIINVASVLSLHTLAISAVYSATKAFVLAFSRGVQEELVGTGVRVQVVLPAATATELWDNSGVPLTALAPETVMGTDAMVDAAMTGLDAGEAITMPSVADANLITSFDTARIALFAASQTGIVAPRLVAA